jgi:RNA polymerase-interacting CarD/CdnL/TRCF family regulator
LTIDVGDKIYYCGRGPCLVGAVVRKDVCGTPAQFHSLSLLDGSGGQFLVPLGSIPSLPLRPLLHRQKMPELLSHLKECGETPKEFGNWKQRDLARTKLFSSGTVFDLADAVESLTQSSRTRNLAQDERQTLQRAKRLLICEIAEVMNESENAAESRINTVLKPGTNVTNKLPRKLTVYRPRAKSL